MLFNYIFQDILTLLKDIDDTNVWLTLSSDHYVLKRVLDSIFKLNDYLHYTCMNGKDIRLINTLIKLGADDFTCGFTAACKCNRKDIAELMIKYGADLDLGTSHALHCDHKEIMDLIVKNRTNDYCDQCLYYVCQYNRKDLAEFMIKNYEYEYNNNTNYNYYLGLSCYFGSKDLAEFIIEHYNADNFNYGLNRACSGNHKDLIDLMIKHGANNCANCNKPVKLHNFNFNLKLKIKKIINKLNSYFFEEKKLKTTLTLCQNQLR